MKAFIFQPPGGQEALSYSTTFPTPSTTELEAGEILIKVAGAGLIAPEISWPIYQAKYGTWPARILCPDYAGTVTAVATDVVDFSIGDEVMAVTTEVDPTTGVRRYQGGAAEYAVAQATSVMKKPKNVSLREAASIPLCALTAWQAFHEQADGRVKPGAEVLITGGGGATGLWAVQVAKLMGARVTVTASDSSGIAILLQLGADEIVNYKKHSLVASGRKFDVVLDAVGGQVFHECTQVVKLASNGGLLLSLVEYGAQSQTPQDVQGKFFIWREAKDQMDEIVALIEAEKLRPIVDSYFPLSRGVEAFSYASKGHCHGKVVLEP